VKITNSNISRILMSLFTVMTLGACGDGASEKNTFKKNGSLVLQVEQSFEKWKTLKAENGEKYQYVTVASSWVGWRQKSLVMVDEDGVFSVKQVEFEDHNSEGVEVQPYDTLGFSTMETLYEMCIEGVLSLDSEDNHIYLQFDERGILTHCQYEPKGCADDCVRGSNIRDLKFVEEYDDSGLLDKF